MKTKTHTSAGLQIRRENPKEEKTKGDSEEKGKTN